MELLRPLNVVPIRDAGTTPTRLSRHEPTTTAFAPHDSVGKGLATV